MPDTENSIEEQGIPEITLRVTALNTTQNAVDATLRNEGEAADAKAAGDAIRSLESTVSGLNAETLYMDDEDETETNTIAAKIGDLEDAIDGLGVADIAYDDNDTLSDKLDAIDTGISGIQDDLYATEIPMSSSDTTKISEKIAAMDTAQGNAILKTTQTLTTAEQAQARTNIAALGSSDIAAMLTYNAQTLTNDQKAQVRTNIGAADDSLVLKKESQTIGAETQATVRQNIGALGAADAVLTTAQTLTSESQAIARNNIGALGASSLTGLWLRRVYNYDYADLAANAILNISKANLGIENISGYEILTIARAFATSNGNVAITRWNATGDSTFMTIRNLSSYAASGTATVDLIWVKTGMSGS